MYTENDFIDSHSLKTCLLYILYENRNKKFKTSLSLPTVNSAIFWANQILDKLQEIYSAPQVNFERFHDKLARKISGRNDLQYCKLFEHDQNHHGAKDEQCCKNRQEALKIIREMQLYLKQNIWEALQVKGKVNVCFEKCGAFISLNCDRGFAEVDRKTEQYFVHQDLRDVFGLITEIRPFNKGDHDLADDLLAGKGCYNSQTGDCAIETINRPDEQLQVTMSDFLAYESEEGFTPRIHFDKLEDVIRRLFAEAERLKREETAW